MGREKRREARELGNMRMKSIKEKEKTREVEGCAGVMAGGERLAVFGELYIFKPETLFCMECFSSHSYKTVGKDVESEL